MQDVRCGKCQKSLLGTVKGKFILSLNDTPGVRETFCDFRIEAIKTRYSISGSNKQEASEVLITNFQQAG